MDFWLPSFVENPSLKNDVTNFFFSGIDESVIDKILSKKKHEVSIICDRFEFVIKLLELRNIFAKNKNNVNTKLEKDTVNGKEVLKVIQEEIIILDGKEFNGITFDIDALCQYLLLTIIDSIMGKIEYQNFTKWLKINHNKNNYDIEELDKLQKLYDEENGLRRNFIHAFFDHLSPILKKRITNTFVIAKADCGEINQTEFNEWLSLDEDTKYLKIVKFLYDQIRCRYTHSATRSFLADTPIVFCKPSKKKTLVSIVNPKTDNLVNILFDVVKELMIKKYVKNTI